MAGVKLAKEISAPCFVDLPIQDFGVPQVKDTIRAVEEALVLIAVCRRPVYAGCMGGIGRTGLFLALLAKAFGVTKPVEYVRQNYYSHAVETKEQFDFVASFPITPAMRKIIKGAKFRWFWRQALSTNLTKSIDKP
jgi:hypothetical protein